MNQKILFVDDEPNILASFRRSLGKRFEMELAPGPKAAVEMVTQKGPFAVVVSDLKMPEMDGIQLLSVIRKKHPDTVRIILTGHADLDAAILAVNDGAVFRFLTKPCNTDSLVRAVTAGLEQYRLVTAEKELLHGTLRGSVKLCTDIMALVNPVAFGRSERIKRWMVRTARQMGEKGLWQYELAAMLSQIGALSIDEETLEKKFSNKPLSPEEQQIFDMHPSIAASLLRNIPRMQEVISIIGAQEDTLIKNPDQPMGARLMRLAMDYDSLEQSNVEKADAMKMLQANAAAYDPRVLKAFEHVLFQDEGYLPRQLRFVELKTGMILTSDLLSEDKVLLMVKGQELTEVSLLRLGNFAKGENLVEPIDVNVPIAMAS